MKVVVSEKVTRTVVVPTGKPGKAATIAVEDTITLPAGTPAEVANVGTETDARLVFGIPQGADGGGSPDFVRRLIPWPDLPGLVPGAAQLVLERFGPVVALSILPGIQSLPTGNYTLFTLPTGFRPRADGAVGPVMLINSIIGLVAVTDLMEVTLRVAARPPVGFATANTSWFTTDPWPT